jgi:hypothetical protein
MLPSSPGASDHEFEQPAAADASAADDDNPVLSSPVASRKQLFENIFVKPSVSLMSPSDFKHYQPGSLVKQRHSWIQEDLLEKQRQQQELKTTKMMANETTTAITHCPPSPSRRHDSDGNDPVHSTARPSVAAPDAKEARDDDDNDAHDESESSNDGDSVFDGKVLANPTDEHVTAAAEEAFFHLRDVDGFIEFPDPKTQNQEFFSVSDFGLNTFATTALDRVHDDAAAAATYDREGEAVMKQLRRRRQAQEAALRQEKRESRRIQRLQLERELRMTESDDPKIAAEALVPTMSTEVADLLATTEADTKRQSKYKNEDWKVVQLRPTKVCATTCLDAMACTIL